MSDEPIPYIEPGHYDHIRALAPDLPASYEQWQSLHKKEVVRLRKLGQNPVPITIHPAVFEKFLAGRERNVEQLRRCAVELHERHRSAGHDYDPFSDVD